MSRMTLQLHIPTCGGSYVQFRYLKTLDCDGCYEKAGMVTYFEGFLLCSTCINILSEGRGDADTWAADRDAE
jgi:hypothetical protein